MWRSSVCGAVRSREEEQCVEEQCVWRSVEEQCGAVCGAVRSSVWRAPVQSFDWAPGDSPSALPCGRSGDTRSL